MTSFIKKQRIETCLRIWMAFFFSFSVASNSYAYQPTAADEKDNKEVCADLRRFTFSWNMLDQCGMTPRGGTTKGVKNVLDPEPHPGWVALQERGISQFEKDRRAILAMAGPYRVSFDFLETVGYVPGFSPSKPYQSWGTEYVYVVEDRGDFISLQHIMVMFFEEEDGNASPPVVMKHWRQDWQYQKARHFVYRGHSSWQQQVQPYEVVKDTWSQAVYQVDDSPRYESFGRWEHHANMSSWVSGRTWRPLPRRESTVREDYHVLEGINRHTVLPNGWVQEEENLKLVLDKCGEPDLKTPYLSKEFGIARYERIINHDFSAGDQYWQKSAPFWADVRQVWREIIERNRHLVIHKQVDNQYMFMPFFQKAQAVADGQAYDPQQGRIQIRKMLTPFIEKK